MLRSAGSRQTLRSRPNGLARAQVTGRRFSGRRLSGSTKTP